MRARQIARRSALIGLVVFGVITASEPADRDQRWRLTGGCYCRIAGELQCLGELTEPQCARRCGDELCDDWFWLERLPCWTWGYGG